MGSTDRDINSRISLTWTAFGKLKTLLTARNLNISLKIRLFNAACISILLYGCESWVLKEKQMKKLDVFVRSCYRIMLNIKQADSRITNEELYRMADGQVPVSETIRVRQLQFTGHCLRMGEDEPSNIYCLFASNNSSSRKQGAPTRRYIDKISTYLGSDRQIKYSAEEITKYAKDKSFWKKHVAAPKKPDR